MSAPAGFVRVCEAADIPEGEMRKAATNPPVVVYHLDDRFYATADLCTHDQSSLADEGYIEGCEIECGWHYAKFCIKTGAVTAPPAQNPLQTYEVAVADGAIYVNLESRSGSEADNQSHV